MTSEDWLLEDERVRYEIERATVLSLLRLVAPELLRRWPGVHPRDLYAVLRAQGPDKVPSFETDRRERMEAGR